MGSIWFSDGNLILLLDPVGPRRQHRPGAAVIVCAFTDSSWGGAMPKPKITRTLASVLIATASVAGCDHIKYHIDRAIPTAANPYRINIPCDIANAAIEQKVAMQTLKALTASTDRVAPRIQSDCMAAKLPRDEVGWNEYIRDRKLELDNEEKAISGESQTEVFAKNRDAIEKKLDALKEAILAQNKLKKFVADTLPGEWISEKLVSGTPARLRAHVEVTARSPEATPKEASKGIVVTLSDRGQNALIQYVEKQNERDLKADSKPSAKPKPNSNPKPIPLAECDPKGKPDPKQKPDSKQKSSAKDSKGDKAIAGLLKTLRNKEVDEEASDSFNRRRSIPLLISTAFNSNSPADRLEKVYIFIQPLGGSKVLDVDKVTIETVKGLAALGKEVTTEEAAPFFSLENFPFGAKATGKGGVASSKIGRQLERTLTRQFALRTISLNSDRDILIVRQEGQEGTDVTGSVLSTITLQLPNEPGLLNVFAVVEKAEGDDDIKDPCNPSPQPTIKKSLKPIVNVGDVEAAVTWIALTRVVESGAGTITEEDDEVHPIVFADQFKTKLWSNELGFFTLRLRHKIGDKCYSVPLVYRDPDSEYMRLMVFKDHPSAARFKGYLGANEIDPTKPATVNVGSETIEFGLPIASDGKIDPKKLNFDWKSTGRKAEETKKLMKDRIQNLFTDVSEPNYFPLSLEFPARECD
jgi:hypothetical protein